MNEDYLGELAAELHWRGVEERRIRDIVAEAESHLLESGESARSAFGLPAEYAERMAVRDETRTGRDQGSKWSNRVFRATAVDEMRILDKAGREGWELMDVGALALFCRRPLDLSQACRWEYKRRTGPHRLIILEEMAREQWEPCGNWLLFHYFKRKADGRIRTRDHA
jgi:hypothetical protein